MKKPVAMTLALLLCSFLFAFTAGAVDAPHYDPAAGNVCGTCHTAQLTLGSTGYNNICQNCHRPGDPAAGSKPITLADAANPFGIHSTTGISKMYQTSHRWDGSEVNPAAGAHAPVQGQMTTNGLRSRAGNQLACVRCHNQHDNSNGNFLRVQNDKDQLCMDCHSSRNVQSHTQGSHPVNVVYADKYAAKPGAFNPKPVNLNPANPTSNLFTRISSAQGLVLCSTCHSVHFADSRSGTVDGSANFANLSSGDGFLLRTDRRGIDPGARNDSANICTICHAGKKSHNMKGQDIQCADCHGAHVEYDQDDPTGTKGTNINLIRRNAVTKDGHSNGKKVFFRYTGSKKEYVTSDSTGVCQSCHVVPAPDSNFGYPPEHNSSDPKVCNTCHFHNSANGSFSGACTSCHGYPPTTTNGLIGYASTEPKTGATQGNPGAHETHATLRHMACITCHVGYAAKTMPSNSIDIGFSINNGTYKNFVGAATGGTFNGSTLNNGYVWSTANGTALSTGNAAITCSVYCHGSTLTGGIATPPIWTTTDGTQKACGACHGVTPATAPVTGSHTRHAKDNSIACATCHGAHDNRDHVNGSVEWNFSALGSGTYKGTASGATGSIAPSASYGSCSNLSCHSSGQAADGSASPLTYGSPSWGGTLTCGDCHKNMKMDATAPGSHVKHAQTRSISCATCHNGYTETSVKTSTHTNGMVNLSFSGDATNATYSQYSTHPLGNGYGTCSNVSCHTTPYGTTAVTTPKWGASACSGCHNSSIGPVAAFGLYSVPATGSHVKHLGLAGAQCGQCHTGAVAGSSGGSGHLNGSIDVTGGYPSSVTKHAPGTYTGTCSTATCHVDPYSASSVTSPVWGTTAGCAACHNGVAGAFGTNGAPATGSHDKHMSRALTCGDCHSGAVAGSSGGAAHADGNVDVLNGYPANVTKHTAGTYSGSCTTTCHSATTTPVPTPAWGIASSCSSCHDPANTGSHGLHLGLSVQASCGECHLNANIDTNTAGTNHLNGTIDVLNGYPAKVAKHTGGSVNSGAYSGTCSTASCHADPYSASTISTPVWGVEAGNHCAGCHNGSGAFDVTLGSPSTGSHAKHMALSGTLCNQCHAGAEKDTLGGNTHRNGSIEITNVGYAAGTSVTKHGSGSGYSSCNNASCHANPYGAGTSTTPVWGATGSGCDACHSSKPIGANGPATGGHTLAGHAVACVTCHTAGTSATHVPDTLHADGSINIVNVGYVAGTAVAKHASGSGYSSCSTASCHANPYGSGTSTTPAWGATGSGCDACHSAKPITATGPATGGHTLAGHAVACVTCHTAGTTATHVPDTLHADGSINIVNVGYVAGTAVAKHASGSGYSSCSTASCHANPYGIGTSTTPAWGATGSGCDACHSAKPITATGPATGSHSLSGHAVVCTTCHAAGTTATAVPGTLHADGFINVVNVGYVAGTAVAKHTSGSGYSSCSTAVCHGSSSPAWGGNTSNDLCAKCHHSNDADLTTAGITATTRYKIAPADATATDTGKVSSNTKIGAHQTHLRYFNGLSAQGDADTRCKICHGASLPTSGSHATGTSANPNSTFNGLAKGTGTYPATYSGGNCSVYCHNPTGTGGTLAAGNAPVAPTVAWTNANYIADGTLKNLTNCTKCHLVPGAAGFTFAGLHGTITTDSLPANNCAGCHGHEGDAGGVAGQQHMDGIRYASGGTSCDGCHDYDTQGTAPNKTWGTVKNANYGGNGEGIGAHAKHIEFLKTRWGVSLNAITDFTAGYASGNALKVCNTCHTKVNHMNVAHKVEITFGDAPSTLIFGTNSQALMFGSTNPPVYNGVAQTSSTTAGKEKTCSNISCHYFTTPTWSTY